MKSSITNFTNINTHTYVVRTQAGYRKACKMFCRNMEFKKNIPDNKNMSYPCLVIFRMEFDRGYYNVNYSSLTLNDLRDILKEDNQIKKLLK